MDHRLHDQRSLAMHRLIAEKLARNPGLLEVALATIARWRKTTSPNSRPYLDAWQAIIEQGLEATIAAATDPSERGIQMRQAAPFTGILTQEERAEFMTAWNRKNGVQGP